MSDVKKFLWRKFDKIEKRLVRLEKEKRKVSEVQVEGKY